MRNGNCHFKNTIMENPTSVLNFSDFIIHYGTQSLYLNEGFAFREITPETWTGHSEFFTQVHSILFVCEGSMTVKFNGRDYLLPRNGFSDVIDLVPIEITAISNDLRAFHLLFTENFLSNLIKNRPPFPLSYMMEMTESPVWVVSESDRTTYLNRLSSINAVLRNVSHHFRSEMLKNAFWMFLLDVADTYLHRGKAQSKDQEPNHLRSLFFRFMRMLPKYVSENHSVSFFASQLCITPQYLNRVVRRISGQSASEAINRMLTGEIIKLLDDKDLSIQEIADRLCFADQATMSKFFKRQKGVSPTTYRLKG